MKETDGKKAEKKEKKNGTRGDRKPLRITGLVKEIQPVSLNERATETERPSWGSGRRTSWLLSVTALV